jgi:zinc finger protein
MMTKVPFFKDLVISSFNCYDCGYKNTETQSAGQIQDLGHKLILTLNDVSDIQRDIVRSEFALIRIKEVELEIPATKKGQITTIEGVLDTTIEELMLHQEARRQ